MLTAVVVVPSAPLLIPELTGPLAAVEGDEIAEVRAAVRAAADCLATARRWIAVGVDDVGHRGGGGHPGVATAPVGTFLGFGADVVVSLVAECDCGVSEPDPRMPLAMLIAAWLRSAVAPSVNVEPIVVAADTEPSECLRVGAKLRRDIDECAEDVGVLVVADGSICLSDRAPGGYRRGAQRVQDSFDDAFASGSVSSIAAMTIQQCASARFGGRAAFQVAAGVLGMGVEAPRALVGYRGHPFGVGYTVGVWRPGSGG